MVTSPDPTYDTYPGEVVIRAEFDVCTQSSFGEVKTHKPTEAKRTALYHMEVQRVESDVKIYLKVLHQGYVKQIVFMY